MELFIVLVLLVIIGVVLVQWYFAEQVVEGDATVRLQSEHEHFHFHVELPSHMEIEPGDTLHILSMPEQELDAGRTIGEITYESKVRLTKASWLQRQLIRSSSLMEVTELIED
ncbi:MAG: hypothetical protein AAFQ07_19750 [Chloroflexota bacterium]